MLYVNSLVLDYPACVSFKEVLKRLAENGSDGKLWSDAKGEVPMLTRPSPIQSRSNYCDYYFPDEMDCAKGDCESDELRKFGWPDFVHADRELRRSLTEEQKRVSFPMLLHVFNDYFREHPTGEVLEGFILLTIKIIMEELLTYGEVDTILKGELLRELGRYDESVEMLEKARAEQPDMEWLIDQILEHAKNHDWKVFEITNVPLQDERYKVGE